VKVSNGKKRAAQTVKKNYNYKIKVCVCYHLIKIKLSVKRGQVIRLGIKRKRLIYG